MEEEQRKVKGNQKRQRLEETKEVQLKRNRRQRRAHI